MWTQGWREKVWSELDQPWDVLIIGGGITGAGILREARRLGLKALLVEAQDFASGTSSRSGKMVHGGLRYLKNGKIKLVMESVQERERLIQEGRGLVNPLGFLLVNYAGDKIPAWVFKAGLVIYDILALKWGHREYDAYDIHDLCPSLAETNLLGGFRYFDATTDDARLVLRIIQEAVQDGGVALNYAKVIQLLRKSSDQVCGVVLQDCSKDGQTHTVEIQARVVISAAGAWSDEIRSHIEARNRLRKLRGSHLFIPAEKLPLTRAISFLHPRDGRPLYALPWEGVVVIGTTDVDHDGTLQQDISISPAEIDYLIEATRWIFPGCNLTTDSIQSTQAGVRPVVDTGKADPSKESREHILWMENGLLTVTGGKLTTFRLMAHDALQKVRSRLPGHPGASTAHRMLSEPPLDLTPPGRPLACEGLSPTICMRLLGRYGAQAPSLLECSAPGESESISGSASIWAEIRWAARSEGVVHLDDLLFRRVRLGLLLPEGGMGQMERIRQIAQPELGWSDDVWEQEHTRYRDIWRRYYSL